MKQQTFLQLFLQTLSSDPLTFLLRSTFPPQEIGGAKILVPTALYKTHYIATSSSNHNFGFQILKMFILILRLDLSSFQFGVESVYQRVLHYLPELTSFTQSYVSVHLGEVYYFCLYLEI